MTNNFVSLFQIFPGNLVNLGSFVESIMYFLLNLSCFMDNNPDSTFKVIIQGSHVYDSCTCFVTNVS